MPNKLNVVLAIQNGQPSIQFQISNDLEGPAKEKIMRLLKDLPIQEAVMDSLAEFSQARFLPTDEVEVQDVPQQSVQQSKPCSGSAKKKAKITESQLSTLRDILAKKMISESSFCAQHGVDRLENLPGGTAWHILHEWLG